MTKILLKSIFFTSLCLLMASCAGLKDKPLSDRLEDKEKKDEKHIYKEDDKNLRPPRQKKDEDWKTEHIF